MATPRQEIHIPHSGNVYPLWVDILVWLSAFFLAALLSVALVGWLTKSGVISEGLGVFFSYLLQFGLLIVLGLWHRSRCMPGRRLELSFSFHWSHITRILAGTLLITAIGLVIEPLLNLMPEEGLERLNNLMGRGGWMMLTAVAAAPVLEEVFFRGIVQGSLAVRRKPLAAILIASAVFGVVHFIPQQVLNAFFVGLVLGYVYYRTRSLLPVVSIHCINNAVACFTWIITGEQLLTTRKIINDDTTYYILYGVAAVIMLASFAYMARNLLRAGETPPEINAENPPIPDTNLEDEHVNNK